MNVLKGVFKCLREKLKTATSEFWEKMTWNTTDTMFAMMLIQPQTFLGGKLTWKPLFFFFFTEIQLNLLHCAKHTYFAEKNNVLMNKWTQTVTLTLLWSCLCLCVLFLRQLFSLFYSPSYILTFLCLNVLFSFIWQFLHLLFTFYTGLFLCVYSVLYAPISYDT